MGSGSRRQTGLVRCKALPIRRWWDRGPHPPPGETPLSNLGLFCSMRRLSSTRGWYAGGLCVTKAPYGGEGRIVCSREQENIVTDSEK